MFTLDVLKQLDTVVRPIYEYSELKEASMSELSDNLAMDDTDMDEGLSQILDMADAAAKGIKESEKTIDNKK